MNNSYRFIVNIAIGVSIIIIVAGVIELVSGRSLWNRVSETLSSPIEALNRQDIADQPTPAPVEAAPDAGCCEQGSFVSDEQTNPTAVMSPSTDESTSYVMDTALPQYATMYWQDDFTNTSSGWEPYFEIQGELPVYAYANTSKTESDDFPSDINYVTSNATAWNGYDGGDYSFTLPGAPMRADKSYDSGNYGKFDSLITPYLWDFNISQPLPAYPYMVDVFASTTLGSGAMIVLDFAGEVNNVSAGSGIVVMMPMDAGDSPRYFQNNHKWRVYEFNNNRLWNLGCMNRFDDQSYDETILSNELRAKIIVDQNAISMRITGNKTPEFSVKCQRVFDGNVSAQRYLGLGSRFWPQLLPVPYANVLRFHHVTIAQPDAVMMDDSTYSIDNAKNEIRDADCQLTFGESNVSEDVTLDSKLRGTCFDTITWVTDPNPSADRIVWPADSNIAGRWQCGLQELFANFEIRTEQDYALISIAGLEYRVIATTESDYPYMMLHFTDGFTYDSSSGTYKWHAEARIGDRVSSPSRILYGMRLNPDGTLRTSWMKQTCTRS